MNRIEHRSSPATSGSGAPASRARKSRPSRAAEVDDLAQRRHVVLGAQELDVVRVEEVGDGEEQPHIGAVEDVAGLAALEAGVGRYEDRARREDPERGDDPLAAVRRPDRDAIAGRDAARDERAPGACCLLGELRERQAYVGLDEGFARAEPLGGPAHEARYGRGEMVVHVARHLATRRSARA